MSHQLPIRPSHAQHNNVIELGQYIATSGPARGRYGNPPSQPAAFDSAVARFNDTAKEDDAANPVQAVAERSGRAGRFIRRAGALALITTVVGGGAYELLASGINYATTSAIPTTEQVNPKLYVHEAIPKTGAFDFAAKVDPDQDPRIGVQDFEQQLGHEPNQGDIVAVPRNH
jgi:hypothetical protein